MGIQEPALLPITVACLVAIGKLSSHGIKSIVLQIVRRTPKDNFYEDRDGKSTPEAIAAFSNKLQKIFILLFALLGFATSIAISVLTTLNLTYNALFVENWLATAAWAFITIQAINIFAVHAPVRSQFLAVCCFLACALNTVLVIFHAILVGGHVDRRKDPAFILRIVNLVVVLLCALACLLVPRRPDVFYRGRLVDRQFAVSTLSRYTWSWPYELVSLATKQGDLHDKDIPEPDQTNRSEEIMKDWKALRARSKLALSIFHAYKYRLLGTYSIVIIRCAWGVLPFWCMKTLINKLELRGGGGSPTLELWGLAAGIGLGTWVENFADGFVSIYSITRIGQPLRTQLSALIFEKALRRKDVKAADPAKDDEAPKTGEPTDSGADASHTTNGAQPPNGSEDSTKKDASKSETPAASEEPSVLKTRQAVVNLVGVDTRHIWEFFTIQYFILLSIGRLISYSGFLISLLGWVPFVVGIIAWGLVLPVNIYFSKRYLKMAMEVMGTRDRKVALVNEALTGIRQIKFSAMEQEWEDRIMTIRNTEMKQLWSLFLGDVVLFGCWTISPILLAAASLVSYALLHGGLSPSVAFVSIGIFKALETTLGSLPEIMTMGFETLVSIGRIDTYLRGPEIDRIVSEGENAAFENATIAWPVDTAVAEQDRFILKGLNLSFPPGELSVISGKTGTGKSLLLSALIGEADLLDGKIFVPPTASPLERHDETAHPGNWILPGSIAYVAQTPWLESASLRDNIVFGLPLVESRYNTVLEVCALKKDLEILRDGDRTELGANGINLSGGQKWRVSLARAIYSRAEILVMDDIFSAVDAHVGRQIYEKCIGGEICKNRTRVLVTHHVGLVQPTTKYLVELGEGSVLHSGLVDDLIRDGTLQKIKEHERAELQEETNGESSTAVNSEQASLVESPDAAGGVTAPKDTGKNSGVATQFVQDEKREKGYVKMRVYAEYLKANGGLIPLTVLFLIFALFEIGNVGRGWWVRLWTGSRKQVGAAASSQQQNLYEYSLQQDMFRAAFSTEADTTASDAHGMHYYLWIYVAISIGMGFIGISRFFWSFRLSIRASRTMYQTILSTIMRTPLRWVDTVPIGRILNRMTADFDVIDQRLTMNIGMLLRNLLILTGICVASAITSPYTLPLALFLMAVGALIGKKYLEGARPLKRLESTAKSPVLEVFSSTLAGMSTLRAFQKSPAYIEKMYGHLDSWATLSVHIWNVNRWLSLRMTTIGASFTTIIAFVVICTDGVDAALAGFTLSFALDFSQNIILAVRAYSTLELDMNAAERVIEYSEVMTEAKGGEKPPAAWPTSGRVEVEKLVVGYAEDLPPVLKGISFDVKDNERIGVVGRTGAGKSSLTLALFRFLEPRAGSIFIDGLDVSKMDLHSLRSRLAIIPQDPVLFSGTIRDNLDPFKGRSDDELREALTRVHLIDSAAPTPANEPASAATSIAAPQNANVFRDLSSSVSEGGGNLSQGQRQLLCLARAIVSRPKIMVLDEATSAVDMQTDGLIQRSIREEFNTSSLIVIAHRLSTIADFDRILVLSEGEVAEFGTPKELWEKEGGLFRDMCEHSGEKEKLAELVLSSNA